jgi:hypothetical protein
MGSNPTWTHLVRIKHKGVPTFAHIVDLKQVDNLPEQFEVKIATGDPVFNNIIITDEKVTVGRNTLLAPFATVPIVINTGLNYKDHVTESLFYSTPVSSSLYRAIYLISNMERILLLRSHISSTVQPHPLPTRIPLSSGPTKSNKSALTMRVSLFSRLALCL